VAVPTRPLLVAVAALLVIAAPASAATKPAKVKCKVGQVPVKVAGKTLCVAARGAFPRPKAGDVRLLFAQGVLGGSVGAVKDTRGRPVLSQQQVFAKLGLSRTYKGLLAFLPKALARLDQLRGGGRRATAAATADCLNGNGPPIKDSSFSGSGFDARIQSGQAGSTVDIGAEAGAYKINVSFDTGCKDQLKLPPCPTAQGALDGIDGVRDGFKIVITKGSTVVDSTSASALERTQLKGVVGDDAKLDSLEITSSLDIDRGAGGTKQAFGAVSIKAKIKRHARIDMRSGAYSPESSDLVDIAVTVGGVRGDVLTDYLIGNRLRAESDAAFAAGVDRWMKAFRARETAWNQPNAPGGAKCAELTFSPASRTLKLKRDESGQFRASIAAKEGGAPPTATWTLTDQRNATFQPPTAKGSSTQFGYGVTSAGPGVEVSAKLRAVSRAGVAEDTWVQSADETVINRIEGSFNGSEDNQGSVLTWEGGIAFAKVSQGASGVDGLFDVSSGQATITASGRFPGGSGCMQSGTKVLQFGPGDGNVQVGGTSPPYSYQIGAHFPFPEGMSMSVQVTSCDNPANNGSATIGIGVDAINSQGLHSSPDGVVYEDTVTISSSGVTQTWRWAMRGSP
jgi:hypothetical protein